MYSNKKTISDEELLVMIKTGKEDALDYIYKKNYNMIIGMILRKGGTEDQAKDIFQDSLIVLWQKVIGKDFVLKAKISTYLYSVCRNLWLKEFNRNTKYTSDNDLSRHSVTFKDDLNESSKIVHDAVDKLGDTCKKMLQLYYFDGMSLKEICKILNFANVNSTKTKRYKCKKQLDSIIKAKYTATDIQD